MNDRRNTSKPRGFGPFTGIVIGTAIGAVIWFVILYTAGAFS